MKFNVHKQMLFILNDYLDTYLHPVLDGSMMARLRKPSISKSQIKQAKLRQVVYKRLLDDLTEHSKHTKQTEVIRVALNELKLKYSLTKIMQIVQLNCNMLNVYLANTQHHDSPG